MIASECLARGLHILITKPPVKTLAEHNDLGSVKRHSVFSWSLRK